MMKRDDGMWECAECGELNRREMILCSCGNMDDSFAEEENEVRREVSGSPQKQLTTQQICKKIFSFIVVVIFVAWVTLISKQTAGRPFFVGKVFTVTATAMTLYTIDPLEKIVGPKNVLLIPFKFVKDRIFNIGLQFFPEDDAERVAWWFANYYVMGAICDDMFLFFNDRGRQNFSFEEYEKYLAEIKANLEILATLPMQDPVNKGRRSNMFFRMAKSYYFLGHSLLRKKYGLDYYKKEVGTEHMRIAQNHFNQFLQIRDSTQNETPELYKKHATFPDRWWYLLQHYLISVTRDLIYNEHLNSTFSCESVLVDEFLQARSNLLLNLPAESSIESSEKKEIYEMLNDTKFASGAGTIFNLISHQCGSGDSLKNLKTTHNK